MFFFSSTLYPLWKLREGGSEFISVVSLANPFTYVVELIQLRFPACSSPTSALVVVASTVVFFLLAVKGYDPQRGMFRRTMQPVSANARARADKRADRMLPAADRTTFADSEPSTLTHQQLHGGGAAKAACIRGAKFRPSCPNAVPRSVIA